MELNDKDIIALEAYYDKTLPEAERQIFETRLAADKYFKQAVSEYRKISMALDAVKRQKRLAFLKEIDRTMPSIESPNKLKVVKKWWWLAAAAMLVGVVGIWQLGTTTQQLSPLVASSFEPYPALGITKGDDAKTVRLEALVTYAKNDYKHAIPLLKKAFELEKDSFLLFYQGIALIGNGESKKAQVILEPLQTSSEVPAELVNWYLALAYIETNQKEKALPLLEMVAHTEGGNQEKAGALLEKLK